METSQCWNRTVSRIRHGAERADIARRPAAFVHSLLGEPPQGGSARGDRRRAARGERYLRALPSERGRACGLAARGRSRRHSRITGNEAAGRAERSKEIDRAATRAPTARGSFRGGATDWSLRAAPLCRQVHSEPWQPRRRSTRARPNCCRRPNAQAAPFSAAAAPSQTLDRRR